MTDSQIQKELDECLVIALDLGKQMEAKDRRILELEALSEGNSMHLTTLNRYAADVRERDKRISELEFIINVMREALQEAETHSTFACTTDFRTSTGTKIARALSLAQPTAPKEPALSDGNGKTYP